jgi:uncharacterized protein (DUF488 family)
MPDPIYTVGHGTRSIDELIDILRAVGVRRVEDVRAAPGSRRHPQFGRDALARALSDAGIDYASRRELGGFRTPRPDSPHTAIRNRSFRGYADHMDGGEFREALRALEAISVTSVVAIMCAETLWWRCHRRMIADALVANGHEVVHLISPSARSRHELHPAARIADGRLVYDGGGHQ